MFTSEPRELTFPKRAATEEETNPADEELERLVEETETFASSQPADSARLQKEVEALAVTLQVGDWEGAQEILKKHPELLSRPLDGDCTPLLYALRICDQGREEMVKNLLGLGPDLSSASLSTRQNALHVAVECGDLAAVRLLLAAEGGRALVNSRAEAGMTPLMYAASGESMEVLRALLDAGAELDASDHDQWSAIWALADRGSAEGFKLLLEKGASLVGQDSAGNTILHVAAAGGDTEIIRMILQSGKIDKEVTNDEGMTAKEVAETAGQESVAAML